MIVKHPLIGLNIEDDDSDFPIGDYLSMRNLILPSEGQSSNGNRENMKGNTLATGQVLPTGTNKCIGAYEDRENNLVHYFIWNSNNQHTIYKYNPSDGTHTILVQGANLDFDQNSFITQIAVIERILFWTDRNNIRYINIDRSQIDQDIRKFTVYKDPPPPPSIVRSGSAAQDPSRTFNNINGKNFQFAVRYVFKNNERSLLSPFSIMSPGDQIVDQFNTDAVRIQVTGFVPTEISSEVLETEFYARENNTGPMKLFETIPYQTSSPVAYFYNDRFINTLADQEALQVIEGIPRLSDALTLFKNRLVLSDNLSGFNPTEFTLSLAELSTNVTEATAPDVWNTSKPYFKENATYEVGVFFKDRFGRPTAVRESKEINLQRREAQINGTAAPSIGRVNINRGYINVSLSGTPPEEAFKYQVAITENQTYIQHAQFPTSVLWFLGEDSDTFTYNPVDSFLVKLGGKAFTEKVPSSATEYSKVYLRVPYELPFTPDSTYFVRVMNKFNGEWLPPQKVISFDGIFIAVNNFNLGSWGTSDPSFFPGSVSGGGSFLWMIEIFKPKEEKSSVFYEIGPEFDITNPGESNRAFSTTEISLEGLGDNYPIGRGLNQPLFTQDTAFNYPVLNFEGGPTVQHFIDKATRLESPTNVYNEADEDALVSVIGQNYDVRSLSFPGGVKIQPSFTKFVHDYEKIAWSIGRPYSKIEREQETKERTSIRYSNPYIQESFINGLNSFETQSKYVLPSERTKTRSFVQTGNIILCIHERETTSLYMSEGFVKTGDGEFLAQTQDVFTDQGQRKLASESGTINPESIIEHEGSVFWFDAYKGEVLRYNLNGIVALAETYKTRRFFKERGDKVLKLGSKVIGGYDPFMDMYYLTFPEMEELPATTVGFCDKPNVRRWIGFYDFMPEYYAKINNQFLSFKDGQMWIHNTNPNYGQFYGVDYPCKFILLINENFNKEKIFESMSIESNGAWTAKATNMKGQLTTLTLTNFTQQEGVFYANFLKDENSYVEAGKVALIHGDDIRDKSLYLELENSDNTYVIIDFVNVAYEFAYGHVKV